MDEEFPAKVLAVAWSRLTLGVLVLATALSVILGGLYYTDDHAGAR